MIRVSSWVVHLAVDISYRLAVDAACQLSVSLLTVVTSATAFPRAVSLTKASFQLVANQFLSWLWLWRWLLLLITAAVSLL